MRPADFEQRRSAIENLDRHQFLDAGAGCGKTSVLVAHYVRILERTEDLSPHQILAATFTRKAAAEMKERLRAECRARAVGGSSRWREIARDLESAPIDTIHGICSRILHESAVAAQVDPQFGVVEGADQALLLEDCVRRSLLNRLAADEPTAARLLGSLPLPAAVSSIVGLINDRTRLGHYWAEGSRERDVQRLWEHWREEAERSVESGWRELLASDEWRSALAALQSAWPQDDRDTLAPILAEIRDVVLRAIDHKGPVAPALEALIGLRKHNRKTTSGSAKNWEPEALKAARKAVSAFATASSEVGKQVTNLYALLPREEHRALAELTVALMEETAAAEAAYTQEKRVRAVMDYADLQIGVRELWERRPDVLAAYQRRFRHVLIDELQDTDELQKAVLWPLAEGGARRFVVGDVKQSIYRFRNADVTVFNRVRQEMQGDAASAVNRLEVNFRSTPALTAFFNELFSHPAVMGTEAGAEYEAAYEAIRAQRTTSEREVVEVLLLTGDNADDASSPKLSVRDARSWEARTLAERIREMVVGSAGLTIGEVHADGTEERRPVQFRDIAMLFRSTSDIGLYEHALREAGVPYYVVSGRGFYHRQEVQDVLNCLRALENPRDGVSLIGALRSPLFGLSDETLLWLRQLPGSWWQRLRRAAGATEGEPWVHLSADQLQAVRFAAALMMDLRARKNHLSPARLISELVERTGVSGALAAQFGGRQAVSNLRKLSDLAGAEDLSGSFSLRRFIRRLKDLEVREEREGLAPVAEEQSDVVKLLTIHTAKGLEWPVVIVPDLQRKTGGFAQPVYSHPCEGLVATSPRDRGDSPADLPAIAHNIKARNRAEELAEARRLFYVACTRARDYLVLSSGVEGRNDETPLRWLLGFLGLAPKDLPESRLQVGDGWQGRLEVRRVTGVPLALGSTRSPSPASESEAADPAAAAAIEARIRPIPLQHHGRQRFSVTQLTRYLDCPRRYELRYVLGVPEEAVKWRGPESPRQLTALEFGDVVHRILRLVGTGGTERLQRLAQEGLRLDAHLARRAGQELPRIIATVQAFLDTPLYREVVAPARRLRTEMTVLVQQGGNPGYLLEGKLDALAEDSGGATHLLDYKTGQPSADAVREHSLQLALYAGAVADLRGTAPASAAVVYLTPGAAEVHPLEAEAMLVAREQAQTAVAAIREGRFEASPGPRCVGCPLRWACTDAAR